MVTIDQFKRGLASYVDADILPVIGAGTAKKMLVGAALSLYISNIDKILTTRDNAFINAMGIFDDNSCIDVDRVADALKRNIPDSGTAFNIDVLGIRVGSMTLHKSDVDTLHRYIINS
jgi:hypothetical protein